MLRTALLLSSMLTAACTIGDLPANRGGGGVDAGGGQIDAPPQQGNGCLNRQAAVGPHLHSAGNVTHAGEDCLQAGCHDVNGAGGHFQFGGTVYKSDGKTPNAGVTLRIKPVAGGMPLPLITDTAGNFSTPAGSLMNAFPATTDATACPTLTPMATQLVAGTGGACNSCHKAGGAAGSVITLADQ